jgi:DTW domain-containing protein YfiP
MKSATKFVYLMHPHELKKVRAGTGRFAALSLSRSEIHVGVTFDDEAAVRSLVGNPRNYPVLLYPGPSARDIGPAPITCDELGSRRLTVFFLDATWTLARKMLRLSPLLQALPQITFTPREKSRFVIKRQPHAHCLSTLEATHELLLTLDQSGLDRYERPGQMLAAFRAMQDFQIKSAAARRAPRTRKEIGGC